MTHLTFRFFSIFPLMAVIFTKDRAATSCKGQDYLKMPLVYMKHVFFSNEEKNIEKLAILYTLYTSKIKFHKFSLSNSILMSNLI